MWNGAVFMPLIEEIETIDPDGRCDFSSAATAWLMKNIVSRFWVNSARQSVRVTRVDGIQVDGCRAAGDVDEPVAGRRPCAATCSMHGGDAVVGRGVGRDRHDRQALVGQRRDVLVEVLLGPAHRDHGRPCAGDHARDGGADAAAARRRRRRRRVRPASARSFMVICPDNI